MATLIYPPFQVQGYSFGFAWIFSPPYPVASIDLGMLLVEWVAITLLTIAALYFLGGNQVNRNSEGSAQFSLGRLAIRAWIIFLRVVRILFGLMMGYQILGMMPILSWPLHPQIVTGEVIAQLVIKLFVLLIATLAFFGLRRLINWLYVRNVTNGELLLRSKWAL